MYLLYSALLAAVLIFGGPYWIYEMLRHGKYRKGLRERFGAVPGHFHNVNQPCIWVHAVSVGEVLAVTELVRGLRIKFPQHRVLVSTTTDTGQTLAASRFGAENVFYFPLDFAFAVQRWVNALGPELVVIAETELWPNFLRVVARAKTPIAIVNARISDRSFRGYLRWKGLMRHILQNVHLLLTQTAEDAWRLREIGAPTDRVSVAGNLKYDIPTASAQAIVGELRASLSQSGAGPVLVCGSSVEGEEPLLLAAFQNVLAEYPSATMLLAPRHPQRFDGVDDLLHKTRIPCRRRSEWKGESLAGSVLLIDTIGELSSLYALADIAFVGGSLVPRGGHNIIEPAQYGVAIVVGPYTANFRDIVCLFQSKDAVCVAESSTLSSALLELLAHDSERQSLGMRAAEALQNQRGATERTLLELKALLARSTHEVTPA